jgi:RimJ/RimL family protein N-acetyltransferase
MTTSGFLIGKKIVLRGPRRSDMELYRRWIDNPEVMHFMEMGWRPASDADLDATFRSMAEDRDTIVFVIEDRSSGAPVGTCGLYAIQWIARRAQFNILIGEPSSWNKGFGTEAAQLILEYAFDRLNLESVFLGVNAENHRAVASYEKAGFVREGIRRRLVFRNGRYYDSLMMSVLQDEYRTRRTVSK